MAKDQIKQKQTPETILKLEQALALDATVKEACFYAHISTDTYYRWIKEDKELSDKLESLRQSPILKARQEVIKGLDGNPEFALKYLERKKSDEFSLKQEIGGSIRINDPLENISIEEIREVIKELKEQKNAIAENRQLIGEAGEHISSEGSEN